MIEQNEGAYRLYEKLGYDVVARSRCGRSTPRRTVAGSAREVPAADAHARVRELRDGREPWQRADGTLAHLDDLRGLETDDGAAVFRVTGPVQLAADRRRQR